MLGRKGILFQSSGRNKELTKLNIALIGYGYWGPNLARNIFMNSKYELIGIVDQDEGRRMVAKRDYPVETYASHLELKKELDLVVISTRPESHKSLASYFINKGVNILITKPCGLNSKEAREISTLANTKQTKVFCDFTYHFSPLINFLMTDNIAKAIVCDMREYISYRTSLGIIQVDVDVLADLAVHDIYILYLLKKSLPATVSCLKSNSSLSDQLQSAVMTMTWADGFVATIHVSWNSPRKVRLISITSSDRAILLEELNKDFPIQLVHFAPNDIEYSSLSAQEKQTRNVSYTMGNLELPVVDLYEALSNEFEQIAEVLLNSQQPCSLPDAKAAEGVWRVIEALRKSSNLDGAQQNV